MNFDEEEAENSEVVDQDQERDDGDEIEVAHEEGGDEIDEEDDREEDTVEGAEGDWDAEAKEEPKSRRSSPIAWPFPCPARSEGNPLAIQQMHIQLHPWLPCLTSPQTLEVNFVAAP